MGKIEKLLDRILRGRSDANIAFRDLRNLLLKLGFEERIRSSHHVFSRDGIRELITLQPDGSKAVPYQVKQVRNYLVQYGLADEILGETDQTAEQPAERENHDAGTDTNTDAT